MVELLDVVGVSSSSEDTSFPSWAFGNTFDLSSVYYNVLIIINYNDDCWVALVFFCHLQLSVNFQPSPALHTI